MNYEERKLKRGLKDISPLFGGQVEEKQTNEVLPAEEPSIQILSVFSPDQSGDSLFLNSYLASKLASKERPCTILSIRSLRRSKQGGEAKSGSLYGQPFEKESLGIHLKRHSLSWETFEGICHQPVPTRADAHLSTQLIFLDVEYEQVPHFGKVIPVLDKWILWLQPTVESLSEAYKMMKAAIPLNKHLEYFLLFEGEAGDKKGSFLFERFSQMVTKRLEVNLAWLGYLHLSRDSKNHFAELALNHLFLKPSESLGCPEKIALAESTQTFPSLSVGSFS